MMKTLVLTEVFPPKTGGSGRWLWELYSRWPREQVSVLAGECGGDDVFDARQDVDMTRMLLSFPSWGVIGFGNLRNYMRAYRTVAAKVKHEGIGAIHCGRMLPEGLIARMIRMRFGLPYAVFVHGEELNTLATSRELSFLGRRVMNGATVLVCNSNNTRHKLMNDWNVPVAKVEVMNPGVDTKRFTPMETDAVVRQRLGFNGRRVVLTVGRLQKRKGHAQLIAALPRIIETVPDALYAIVGQGEERASLEKLAQEHGVTDHVRFMDELRDGDLVACMQQCDLFALPNIEVNGDFEGFGMVLVEAQACGKAVLAGRSGGTSEALRDGETGRLVECENTEALAAAVSELLADAALRQRLGAAGRRWVEERFDWNALSRSARRMFETRFGDGGQMQRAAA